MNVFTTQPIEERTYDKENQREYSPAKRSQPFNATYCNTVERNMLRAIGQHVATCCNRLGVIGSRLKIVKFLCNIRGCCVRLYAFGEVRATFLHRTRAPVRFAAPTTYRNTSQQDCALQCCVETVKSFDQGVKLYSSTLVAHHVNRRSFPVSVCSDISSLDGMLVHRIPPPLPPAPHQN